MTKEDLGIYFNWSCNMLAGNPIATDKYLRDNLDTVKRVAAELLKSINYTPRTIYRGIVVPEGELTELSPHHGFTYLSFSEDLRIAKIFADPAHDMAFILRKRLGNDLYGYITEYTPRVEEILFHHRFLSMLPYVKALWENEIDATTIHQQQEVTILQPSNSLILKPQTNEVTTMPTR
jgi:hypothetical protein